MLSPVTPFTIFRRQLSDFRSALPGLLDGSAVGIHDARVATRRIREVLPLTHAWDRHHLVDDLQTAFKRVGRSLGRVRDVDVRVDLLKYIEARIGDAAPAIHLLRRQEERRRLRLMRKLIKRLDQIAVDREAIELDRHAPRIGVVLRQFRPSHWRHELRQLIDERSGMTRDAIAHASGVYFPNRIHRARIAIKKFRYAAEIALATGVLADRGVIRELRRVQEVLGQLHDRETLIRALDKLPEGNGGVEPGQIRMIQQLAEAEIGELHLRFVARRDRVVDCCRSVHRRGLRPADPRVAIAVTSALALAGLAAYQGRPDPR
jgi:CHAD domain-containing protein